MASPVEILVKGVCITAAWLVDLTTGSHYLQVMRQCEEEYQTRRTP